MHSTIFNRLNLKIEVTIFKTFCARIIAMDISLLSCPLCLKPHFEGVDSLRTSLIHAATTHISCPVCNELFLGLDKLTIHLFSHITNKQLNIEVNSIEDESAVRNEEDIVMAEHITEKVDDVKEQDFSEIEVDCNFVRCDICNYYFSDENVLNLHQTLLHQTTPDIHTGKCHYHCHLCRKQFRMRGSLMVHMRVAHFAFIQSANKNNFDYTRSKSNLSKLNSSSSSSSDCAKPTDNCKILKTIKMQVNKQWECEVCLKLFTTKYFLKKHKRLHTGEMPYYCSQCNKHFTFQQSYHKHMLYHSDEKPHICKECGRAFKELSTLHNHQRIHSGERPFSCETCGKSFRQRVSYLVHRRIHTGVMPYKCTACDKSFRYKVSQRSHKCPSATPGFVVRVSDFNNSQVTEEASLPSQHPAITSEENGLQAGQSGNFVSSDSNFSGNESNQNFVNETTKQDGNPDTTTFNFDNSENNHDLRFKPSDDNPDFFTLILSPVLSDVQSLCLSNYTNESELESNKRSSVSKTTNDDILETINEASLKELLYGP